MKLFLVVCLVASVFAAPAQEATDPVVAEVAQNVHLAHTAFQAQDAAAAKTTVDFSAAEVVGQQVDVAQPAEELKVQAKQAEIAEVPVAVESFQASGEIIQPAEEAKVQVKHVEIGEAPAPVEPAQASEEVVHHAGGSEAQARSLAIEADTTSVDLAAAEIKHKSSVEPVLGGVRSAFKDYQSKFASAFGKPFEPFSHSSTGSSKSVGSVTSPEAVKASEAAETENKSATKADFQSKFGSQFGSAFNSRANPAVNPSFFTTPFGAPGPNTPGYDAFGYNRYNPGFQSDYNRYNPGYNQYNPGYNQYNPGSQFGYNKYNPGFQSGFFSNAGKEPTKPADETKVAAKPAGAEASAEPVKATETAKTEDKSDSKTPSTDAASTATSSVSPFQSKFGSQFGSAFNSGANPAVNPSLLTTVFGTPAPNTPGYDAFGYNRYNPGFQSGYNRYNPGYNQYNPGYNQYNPGSQFGYNKYNPGFQSGFFSNAGKEPTKPADETKVAAKPAGAEASAEPAKATEIAKTEDKSATKTPSTDAASTATSSVSPFQSKFGSQFGSAFNSGANPAVNPSLLTTVFGTPAPNTPGYDAFGYNRYNPGFQSGYNRYNPGYNQYNPGYNQYNPGSQFGYNKYNPGFQSGFFSNAGKEPTKPADETKVVAKPAGAEASAEPAKATETAKTEDKPATNTPSTNAASTTTSSVSPFQSAFGSQFGSAFNSGANPAVKPTYFTSSFGAPASNTPGYNAFGYNKYNPSYQPGYNQFNPSHPFAHNNYNPGFQSPFFSNAGKESIKAPANVASAGLTVSSATTGEKLPEKTHSNVAGTAAVDSSSSVSETTVEASAVVEQSPTKTSGSVASPAGDISSVSSQSQFDEAFISAVKPGIRSPVSSFVHSSLAATSTFQQGDAFSSESDEELIEPAQENEFNIKSVETEISSESATAEEKEPAQSLTSDAAPAIDSSSESDVSKVAVESSATQKELPAVTLTSDSSSSTGSLATPSQPELGSTSKSAADSEFQVHVSFPTFTSAFDSSPFRRPEFNSFTKFNPSFQPSFPVASTADKEQVKPVEEPKVKSESAVPETSSAIVKSATAEEKEPAQPLTSDAASAIDSSSESDVSKVAVKSSATEKEVPAVTLKSDFSSSTGSLANPSQPKLGSTFGSIGDFKVREPVNFPAFASAFDSSPFRRPEFNSFTKFNPSFQPSFPVSSTADKEQVKPADEPKVKSEFAVPETSSAIVKSATAEEKEPAQPLNSDAASAIDSSSESDVSKVAVKSSATEKEVPAVTLKSDFSSSIGSLATPSQPKLGLAVDSKAPASVGSPAFSSAFDSSPFRRPEFNTFSFTKFNPTIGKEPVKSAEEVKVKSESAAAEASSGASSGAGSSSGFVAVDSESKPISPFGSAFETGFRSPAHPSFHANSPYPYNSGFGTFSQGKYNPNYQTGYPYDPSFGNYNGNYKYNNYGKYDGYQRAGYPGFPSAFGNYPGYDQAFKGKTTHSQVSSAVANQFPANFDKFASSPSLFRTGFPVPQDIAVSSEAKSSSEQSEHKIASTESVQSQGQFFKNFKSFLVQPTVTPFVEPAASLDSKLEVPQSPTAA